jgi:hypothetical protein
MLFFLSEVIALENMVVSPSQANRERSINAPDKYVQPWSADG